jgi:nicotinamide-nucleotide amidase
MARLAQWGRQPNKGQLRQAMIPAGATVLANPVGSAPALPSSGKARRLWRFPVCRARWKR